MSDTNMSAAAAGGSEQSTSGAPQAAPQSNERPSWLPEGFADGAALAKSYEALRTKMSQGGHKSDPALDARHPAAPEPASTEGATEAAPNAAPEAVSLADAQNIVSQAGFNYADLSAEYARNGGQLSQETYDALARQGITADAVAAHVAGQEAVVREIRGQVFSMVGGEEAYSDMVGWASANLSQSAQASFNAAVNTSDAYQRELAVRGLHAKFTAAVGIAPKLLSGGSGNGGQAAGDVFRSTADLTAAMKDARYSSDADYRKSVADRLARSNIL